MEEEIVYNEVEDEDQTQLYENISSQLAFLNDKFKVYEVLNSEKSEKSDGNIQDCIENKIETLNSKIKEKDNLLRQIQNEYKETEENLNRKLREKDSIIDNLRRELEMIKCERNESISQMHSIIKEIGVDGSKNKFAIFNLRKGGMHSHQNSLTSISSLSTHHDDKNYEKINNEKLFIEKQLVEYKLKFAESSAKLNELEGEFEKIKKRYYDMSEKLKAKEINLKKASEERDHYKYNTSSHYSINSCDYKPPEINVKNMETVHCKKTSSDDLRIMENYIETDPTLYSKSMLSRSETKSAANSRSGSLIKYIKNIFKR